MGITLKHTALHYGVRGVAVCIDEGIALAGVQSAMVHSMVVPMRCHERKWLHFATLLSSVAIFKGLASLNLVEEMDYIVADQVGEHIN